MGRNASEVEECATVTFEQGLKNKKDSHELRDSMAASAAQREAGAEVDLNPKTHGSGKPHIASAAAGAGGRVTDYSDAVSMHRDAESPGAPQLLPNNDEGATGVLEDVDGASGGFFSWPVPPAPYSAT